MSLMAALISFIAEGTQEKVLMPIPSSRGTKSGSEAIFPQIDRGILNLAACTETILSILIILGCKDK